MGGSPHDLGGAGVNVAESRGQFLSIYKMWSAYPTNYVSTDKLGIYDPYNIEVVDLDGLKVMQV